MFSSVADLLPRLIPEVPGCPDNLATLALKDAVREVCRFTEAWTKQLTAIDVVANTAAYTLDPDTTAGTEPEILRITSAKLNNIEIGSERYDLTLNETAPLFQLTFRTGYVPTVSVTGGLVVTVALAPMPGEELPASILTKFANSVLLLAAAELLSKPGKKFSNPTDAMLKRRRYLASLSDIIYQRETLRTNTSPRAYGEPFIYERR